MRYSRRLSKVYGTWYMGEIVRQGLKLKMRFGIANK